MTSKPLIRPYQPANWDAVWPFLKAVFRKGKTYAYPTEITEAEAKTNWIELPEATFVAEAEGEILGTYYLKANYPGPASHTANCGYIVSPSARGRGIASQLCLHSQIEARSRGFLAMQFNFVVSTNESAVRLWKKHGFAIIGTIPAAYRHPEYGYVDAYIMHKTLGTEEAETEK